MTTYLRRSLLGALAALAAATGLQAVSAKPASTETLAALGERLYTQGIGVSGKPVMATDLSGGQVSAVQYRCVSCHRPSGYGSSEGGIYIPPIAAPLLYAPLKLDRTRIFSGMFQQVQTNEFTSRIYHPRMRPAYDRKSLARVLREGIDPAGQPIQQAMPHYNLTERDIDALDAWLRTLSATPSPGVDDKEMRFAVIVTDQTPATTRSVIVDTTRVFFDKHNKDSASEGSRPNFSPFYRSEFTSFWRDWALDVWELKGPSEDWPRQLAAYYAARPVFAVVSGSVPGAWQPVGEFCDRNRVPCLFPLTDLPYAGTLSPGYTLYLSGGLPLEAQAMAAYISAQNAAGRIVQVADAGAAGSVPAAALAAALPAGRVRTLAVNDGTGWAEALRRGADDAGADGVLVVWPGRDPAGVVAALRTVNPATRLVMLPQAAETAAIAGLGDGMADRVRLTHPEELPGKINPHSYRISAWLTSRRVAINPPQEQYKVYYALSVLDKAVMEIQGDYHRDYLVERIEAIAESNLNPGVYPTLSLGPGQRVASRGSYVVRLDKTGPGGIRADGDWIVP